MEHRIYATPWGRRIWLITAGTGTLLLAVAVSLPVALPAEERDRSTLLWTIPTVMLAILGGTALWTIRRIELDDHEIRIVRSVWANHIPLTRIESVEADPRACEGASKTIGNDGLFAMHGRFRSKRLGKFQAYITNPENAVVLRVPGDTIVVSPADPRGFVRELRRRINRLKEPR